MSTMSVIPGYFTVPEVASEIGVTDARIRQMILCGDIEATKLGNSWILRAQVVQDLKARERRPGGRPRISDPR